MRRVYGVVGLLRPGPSSSSMALSSIESERSVEMLARRPPNPKGEFWVGDVPDKPRVEIDIRRRCSCGAAALGAGKGAVGAAVLLGRPKSAVRAEALMEPRLAREASAEPFSLSVLLDIVLVVER